MVAALPYLGFDRATRRLRLDPHEPGEIVQVMPWPVYRYMTDKDLRAVYTYLSSLPHAEAGTCSGRGE